MARDLYRGFYVSKAMDRKIERRRWTWRRLIFILVAGVGVVWVALAVRNGAYTRRLRVDADRLQIATVKEGPFQEYLPVTGEVVPLKTVYLDAVQGGRVEEVYVAEGALVKAGDRLLKLGNSNLLMDIMDRDAELYQQSNNLRNTQLALEQNRVLMAQRRLEIDYTLRDKRRRLQSLKSLQAEGLVPANDLALAQDDYDYYSRLQKLTAEAERQEARYREGQVRQLETSLRQMESNLAVARSNLDGLSIRAPVSGQVTSLDAEVGESKRPGQRLGQVDVLDGFKVRARVDEHYLPRLRLRQLATWEEDGQGFTLVVDRISPEVSAGRCDVDLRFQGEQPSGIRRGQTLRLRLQLSDLARAVLLPKGGFLQDTGGRWVFVLDRSGSRATRRPIRIGLGNPRELEVLEGLTPGERVVVSPYTDFEDAQELVIQ
jgi:HlyD family secretion protein